MWANKLWSAISFAWSLWLNFWCHNGLLLFMLLMVTTTTLPSHTKHPMLLMKGCAGGYICGRRGHEQAEEECTGRCRVYGWGQERSMSKGPGGWQRRGREPLSILYLRLLKTWNQPCCYCLRCWHFSLSHWRSFAQTATDPFVGKGQLSLVTCDRIHVHTYTYIAVLLILSNIQSP